MRAYFVIKHFVALDDKSLVYRQIKFILKSDIVHLSFGNVAQAVAKGGTYVGSTHYWSRSFAWEDLWDVEFTNSLVRREQLAVAHEFFYVVNALEVQAPALRGALKALTQPE